MDRSIYKWHIVEEGITRLKRTFEESPEAQLEPPFISDDFTRLYSTIYRICHTHKGDYHQQLYDNYQQVFVEYLQDTVLPAITQKRGHFMLKELVKRWSNHKNMMSTLSVCFAHLHRVIERKSLPSLSVIGINCFRDQVYKKICVEAKDAIIGLIEDEKEGKQIDRALLKDAISIYKEVGSGTNDENDFETFILTTALAYDSENAPSLIPKDSIHYEKTPVLINASASICGDSEEYLKNEKDIVAHYPHADTEEKLLEQKQDLAMHKYDEGGKKRKAYQIEAIEEGYCWEELRNGPLIEIAQRLSNFEDFEVLHLVCSRWNSILRASQSKFLDGGHLGHCSPQVPWLMMVERERIQQRGRLSSTLCLRSCSSKGKSMRLFFYSLSFQRVRELVVRLPLELDIGEEHLSNCCLYSSHGWLLIITKGLKMSLFNPLRSPTHNYIPLPRHDTLAKGVKKFTLSASPCTKSYTVMLAYDIDEVALWRPGDEEWTLEPPNNIHSWKLPFLDITFYQGHHYALDSYRQIYLFRPHKDITPSGKPRFMRHWIVDLYPNESYEACLWKAYFVVVESSKKVFVVERLSHYRSRLPDGAYLTAGFEVMEIDVPLTPRRGGTHVKEVKSLDNISLFIGSNKAFAIEVPQERVNVDPSCYYYGCMPNRIYFTDDKGKDIGVYNMEDGSIDRHFHGLSLDDYSPLLWVEPRC